MKQTLKKIMCCILILANIGINILPVCASEIPEHKIMLNEAGVEMQLIDHYSEILSDGNILIVETYESKANSEIQPFGATEYINNYAKRAYIQNSQHTVTYISMCLYTSFRFTGTSATCTSAYTKLEKCITPYSVTGHYGRTDGNKGYGYFNLRKNGSYFGTQTLITTCSKTGTLS